jgi:hypothetical protein
LDLTGTGFHRWVLGDDSAGFESLVGWESLIKDTARRMQIPWVSIHGDRYAMQWESLCLKASQNGYCNALGNWVPAEKAHQSNRIEAEMKKVATVLLKEVQSQYPRQSVRANYPKNENWGAVISLNFDTAWFDKDITHWAAHQDGVLTSRVDVAPSRELQRLNFSFKLPCEHGATRNLWYPNGCIQHHKNLRLGLRDFGLQVSAIKSAFEKIKAFETSYLQAYGKDWSSYFQALQSVMERHSTLQAHLGYPALPQTWVTEMLYRPVFFAGVGLGKDELGLWWLMCQRARNLARIPEKDRPKVAILVRQDNPDLEFWQTKPFGIEPLLCSDWNEGWEKYATWS